MDTNPVDHVAQAIARATLSGGPDAAAAHTTTTSSVGGDVSGPAPPTVYHVCHPHPPRLRKLFTWLRNYGRSTCARGGTREMVVHDVDDE